MPHQVNDLVHLQVVTASEGGQEAHNHPARPTELQEVTASALEERRALRMELQGVMASEEDLVGRQVRVTVPQLVDLEVMALVEDLVERQVLAMELQLVGMEEDREVPQELVEDQVLLMVPLVTLDKDHKVLQVVTMATEEKTEVA